MIFKFKIKSITLFEESLNIVNLQALQGLENEVVRCGDHAQVTVFMKGGEFSSIFSVADFDFDNSQIQLIIRSTKTGRVSDYLTNESSIGKLVNVNFYNRNKLYLGDGKTVIICAGSGIAGALGYLNSMNLDTMEIPEFLFVGNDSERPFVQAITQKILKINHSPKFIWHNTTILGRPDSEYFQSLIRASNADYVYSCGPADFNELVSKAAESAGVNKLSVILDGFKLDEQKSIDTSFSAVKHAKLVIEVFGTRKELLWDGRKSLLDTLMDENIQVPYSCKLGICSACQCKVISGLTKMDVDMGLNEEEKKNGLSLACQLHPISSNIEVLFE